MKQRLVLSALLDDPLEQSPSLTLSFWRFLTVLLKRDYIQKR